jgi:sulfur relay protein TusB/DsrH
MANLYLIDRPYGENGLALARIDPDARIVLLQDGVYFHSRFEPGGDLPVYAVHDDLTVRGLDPLVPDHVRRIGYLELVDLIVENKVINFA